MAVRAPPRAGHAYHAEAFRRRRLGDPSSHQSGTEDAYGGHVERGLAVRVLLALRLPVEDALRGGECRRGVGRVGGGRGCRLSSAGGRWAKEVERSTNGGARPPLEVGTVGHRRNTLINFVAGHATYPQRGRFARLAELAEELGLLARAIGMARLQPGLHTLDDGGRRGVLALRLLLHLLRDLLEHDRAAATRRDRRARKAGPDAYA